MDNNYWKALIFSMAVLILYPVFMRWVAPPEQKNVQEEIKVSAVQEESFLEKAEETVDLVSHSKPSIERATPPTIISFENDIYRIDFSTLGGTVTNIFYKGEPGREKFTETNFFEGYPDAPGIFGVNFSHEKTDLTNAIFETAAKNQNEGMYAFVYEMPGEYKITKEYYINNEQPLINLVLKVENLSGRKKNLTLDFDYGMDYKSTKKAMYDYFEAVVFTDKIKAVKAAKIKKKGFFVSGDIEWSGMIKKYFALLIKPSLESVRQNAEASDETMKASLKMETVTLSPSEEIEESVFLYAGPQRYETLKNLNFGFEKVLSRGFFGMFKVWLLISLKFFYQYTHNYGWALVLLTLLIKLIFAPLTHIGYESMKKMQALAPKQKAIQEKYKKDPAKSQKAIMELYKRNKANPMMGCLPMLIQLPILIAMFRLLPEAIELHGAPFIFWIKDLSAPDHLATLPFTIPMLGWNSFNLLPILMAISQYGYQKLMPQTSASSEQAKIMSFMPLFFGVICYNMPSGLTLYWFLQNLFSIVHQVFINRIKIVIHHEDQN